jgi:hypothetical protein
VSAEEEAPAGEELSEPPGVIAPPGPHIPMPPVSDDDLVRWIAAHGRAEMLRRHHRSADDGTCAGCAEHRRVRWPCEWHRRAVRAIELRQGPTS